MSIFRDESQLLVQDAGINPDIAAEMLEDYYHEYWACPDLEFQIQGFLGKRYLDLKEVTEQVHTQVAAFDRDLSSLERPDQPSSKGKVSIPWPSASYWNLLCSPNRCSLIFTARSQSPPCPAGCRCRFEVL